MGYMVRPKLCLDESPITSLNRPSSKPAFGSGAARLAYK